MTTTTGLHTHFDLPGICTDAPHPVPGLDHMNIPKLTAGDMLRILTAEDAAGAASWCLHYASTRLSYQGTELRQWAESMEPGCPVYAEHLHPTGRPVWQRPQDLWLLRIDARTGEVSATHEPGDTWAWHHITGGADAPDPAHPLYPQARSAAVEAVITRAGHRSLSDRRALDQARPVAAAAALDYLDAASEYADRRTAVTRATEALDRAYNRARIARAGVDLDAPEVPGTYDDFYRMGFPPPTHQEMADHILRTHGRTPLQRAARMLRRVLRIPDTR